MTRGPGEPVLDPGTVAWWCDIGSTRANVVGGHENVREVFEPVRIGIGVVVYESDDVSCRRLDACVHAQFRIPRLKRPEDEGGEPAGLVLLLAQAHEVFDPFG